MSIDPKIFDLFERTVAVIASANDQIGDATVLLEALSAECVRQDEEGLAQRTVTFSTSATATASYGRCESMSSHLTELPGEGPVA